MKFLLQDITEHKPVWQKKHEHKQACVAELPWTQACVAEMVLYDLSLQAACMESLKHWA